MKKSIVIIATLLLSVIGFAAPQKVNIDITADDLAAKNGWENSKAYFITELDGNITLHVNEPASGDPSGIYYTGTPGDWRLYQARVDSFFIEAKNGAKIDSVQFTYTNKNNGTLSYVSGVNVAAENRIASDKKVYVGGVEKVCLFVASTNEGVNNGQARISRFRVVYQGVKQQETPIVKFDQVLIKKSINAQTFTPTFTNTSDGEVTYKSENEQVATIADNGAITIVGEGQTKIIVSVAETDNYTAAADTCTLVVYPITWHIETFAEAGTPSTSYATKEASSVNPSSDTGLKWHVLFGFIGTNSGNMGGNGAVIRQRKSTEAEKDYGYLVSDTIENGIDSLAFNWNSNGNESGNWNINIYINDDLVGSITEEATGIKPVSEIPTFAVGNLKKEGKFVIRVVNAAEVSDGTSNSKRFVVDNIEWFGYTKSPVTSMPTIEKTTKVQKVFLNGQIYLYNDGKYTNILGF